MQGWNPHKPAKQDGNTVIHKLEEVNLRSKCIFVSVMVHQLSSEMKLSFTTKHRKVCQLGKPINKVSISSVYCRHFDKSSVYSSQTLQYIFSILQTLQYTLDISIYPLDTSIYPVYSRHFNISSILQTLRYIFSISSVYICVQYTPLYLQYTLYLTVH